MSVARHRLPQQRPLDWGTLVVKYREKPVSRVAIRLEPGPAAQALAEGGKVSVALATVIEPPSPAVAFYAMDMGRTGICTCLEMQLALSAAGVSCCCCVGACRPCNLALIAAN